MTNPTIVPVQYQGDYTDYLNTKVDRSGAVRLQYDTVTIPAVTVVTTVVGLVPFNKGARISMGGTQLAIGDLDTATNVTFSVGVVYETGSSATDDPDAFASALTTAQTGGLVVFDETAGLSLVAEDNGWLAITLAGGSTTTEGVLEGQVSMSYDGINSSN